MRDEEDEAVVIREYDPKTDRDGTDAVDRDCEVGPGGGMSLHADLLGDPVARIRRSPRYLMLVRVPYMCVSVCVRMLYSCTCIPYSPPRYAASNARGYYDWRLIARLDAAISGREGDCVGY